MKKIKDSYRGRFSNEYNIQIWFLPELIELNLQRSIKNIIEEKETNNRNIFENTPFSNFFKRFYPDNVDLYRKMRDRGEPEDELTNSIRIDDVDKVQSILSKSDADYSKIVIPFNIFEDQKENGYIKLINYAASYGSIKCFKFLMLNHSVIDEITFKYAIYGGNTEIIQIVDKQLVSQQQQLQQQMKQQMNRIQPQKFEYEMINGSYINKASLAIARHRNDLFDWILEQKFSGKPEYSFLINSVSNGNAHSFIEVIDKLTASFSYQNLIDVASQKGFYKLSDLIFNIFTKKSGEEKDKKETSKIQKKKLISKSDLLLMKKNNANNDDNETLNFNNNFAFFGNLSIFKLGLKLNTSVDSLIESINICIDKEYKNIYNYYFDELIKTDESNMNQNIILKIALKSLKHSSTYYFNHLVNQVKSVKPNFFVEFSSFFILLENACQIDNIENVKTILNLIKENRNETDITTAFMNAAINGFKEICQIMIDDKFFKIDKQYFLLNIPSIGSLNKDIFTIIINDSSPSLRETFLSCSLYPAIEKRNKDLLELLLNENVQHDNALIKAMNTNNSVIINLILDHDKRPAFINQKSPNGTALHIAINNNNFEIAKLLLSIPGINPSLYDQSDQTPLIKSINNYNLDIMNSIFDFYGENIQSQTWQLDKAIQMTLDMLSSNRGNNVQRLTSSERKNKLMTILKKILEIKNIDPNSHVGEHTLLSYACAANEIDIVKMLLETDRIDVNAYAPTNGNTPLMIAILNKNIEIAELLINDERTNLNTRNYDNKTALIFAVENKLENIISLLIKNDKFDAYESCLDHAFYISKDSISKLLLTTEKVDINYEFLYLNTNSNNSRRSNVYDEAIYETPLTIAVRLKDINKISLIIDHPKFDKVKSQLIRAIFDSIDSDSINIFKLLIKSIDNDVNICNDSETSLLSAAIFGSSNKIVSEILNSEKFDINKNYIMEAFKKSLLSRKFSVDITNQIYNYDCNNTHLIDLNKPLQDGKSFFTFLKDADKRINIKRTGERVGFLLSNGADPNLPDKNGVYPLEFAIIGPSDLDYVLALLNSKKIDLNVKIPIKDPKVLSSYGIYNVTNEKNNATYTTYIHLAALSNNDAILRHFLDRIKIDVNIEDDQGNTPLMIASLYFKSRSINTLFDFASDLDYSHHNKDGKDALQLLGKFNVNPQNKADYKKHLLIALKNDPVRIYK